MITVTQWTTKTQVVYLKQRGAWKGLGESLRRALLPSGVLMFSVLQRGKRTPQDTGATAFIPLKYDVCGDITPHMPSTGNSV